MKEETKKAAALAAAIEVLEETGRVHLADALKQIYAEWAASRQVVLALGAVLDTQGQRESEAIAELETWMKASKAAKATAAAEKE